MAIVGEAHVLVKAITTGFDKDLRRQLQGLTGAVGPSGRAAGESLGSAFNRGFNRSAGNVFTKIAEGIGTMIPEADAARDSFRSMIRTGYTLGTALTSVIGGISALVGGFITLAGAVGRAAPALFGIVTAFVQMRVAIGLAQFALGGIGAAVSAATQAQGGLGDTLKRVNEQFKQLRRDAESAAMSEKRAGLELEKARNNLARMLDLPPNNMARREAELALEEAELNYRQAKERSQDLNDELKKGKKGLQSMSGVDPYAGLTKSQKVFAQFLVKLKPKLDELKEAVASGFLPVLQTQIQSLVDSYFPDLLGKFKEVGDALGKGVINITDNFLEPSTKKEVLTFFDNLNANIPVIGSIFGEVGEIIVKVFNDANGIARKFLDFVLTSLEDWNKQLDEIGLEQFFADAYETGSQLFGIIGNIFNGLGDFFKILKDSGAMDTVLGYLTDITEAFAGIGENKEAKTAIGEMFSGLANNFGPVLNFLGQLVKSFLTLGANPNIGKTFEMLASPENAANWDAVFKAFADAGPSLATLATSIGELAAGFADSGAPKAFFDTLNAALQPLIAFIQDPNNKAFVDTLGRILAVLSAIALGFSVLKFGIFVFFGGLKSLFGFLGKLVFGVGGFFKFLGVAIAKGPMMALKVFAKAGSGVAKFILGFIGIFKSVFGFIITKIVAFGNILRVAFAANPVGLLITAITALIGYTVWFFSSTEEGRKMWEAFTTWLGESFTAIGEWFGMLGQGIVDAWNGTIEWIGGVWEGFVGFLEDAWNGFIGFFQDAGENIGNFFEGVFENIGNFFRTVMNNMIGFAEGFVNFFITGINNIIDALNSIEIVNPFDPSTWSNPGSLNIPRVDLIRLPRLAEGGIVSPSPGGTIAQIAEAGRPERVEPLDDRGLSKRDYAMIEALSSGSGKAINITVNPSAGMDERELADLVSRRIAFEIRKGSY